MTIPGLVRLSDLERRVGELERLVAIMVRMADPTSPHVYREDRDALTAYAQATRGPGPAPAPGSG